jgi:2-phosphosulfolactate phosphatase
MLTGRVAIVVDCLRATTVLCTALDHGAREFHVCLTVDEARARAAALVEHRPLLGGERGGVLIEGFDLDNSPLTYRADLVGHRSIVFTTANGTAALLACSGAEIVLAGCLRNAGALARHVSTMDRSVTVVCSGTREMVSADDCIAAGAVIHDLVQLGFRHEYDDASVLCQQAYQFAAAREGGLARALAESRGGLNLRRSDEGLRDIAFCSQVNVSESLPVFDVRTRVVRGHR